MSYANWSPKVEPRPIPRTWGVKRPGPQRAYSVAGPSKASTGVPVTAANPFLSLTKPQGALLTEGTRAACEAANREFVFSAAMVDDPWGGVRQVSSREADTRRCMGAPTIVEDGGGTPRAGAPRGSASAPLSGIAFAAFALLAWKYL